MGRKTLLVAGLLMLTVGAFADCAFAQLYKGKTITMIVNYPAGGPTDIEGRIVAQHLPNHIAGNPTIIVKNVGGATQMLGNLVYDRQATDIPFAAALATVSVIIMAIYLTLIRRTGALESL